MGALDPHVHKRNQLSLPGSHGDVTRAASDSGQHLQSIDELPADLWPSFATSEDYFSTVVNRPCLQLYFKSCCIFPILSHTNTSVQHLLVYYNKLTWTAGFH